MNRRQLEYFLAVVGRGSFTSAAHALHIAQPSLSHAMGTLEDELGVQLFRRMGRGVALTPAGDALVAPAQQVLRAFAKAQARVQEIAGLVAGRLDIVTLVTLGVNPLVELTAEYRRQHPGVEISIVDPDNAASVADMVRRGDCDLGIADARLDETSGLEVLELPGQEMFVILPPGSELPSSGRMTMADVTQLELISTPPGTVMRTLVEDALSVDGRLARIAVETTLRAVIVPLVLEGVGSTLLPGPQADSAVRLGAVAVPLEPRVVRRGMLVWRGGALSPAGRAFIQLVREWMVDQPSIKGVDASLTVGTKP